MTESAKIVENIMLCREICEIDNRFHAEAYCIPAGSIRRSYFSNALSLI
jgi:hypothetical protein